MSTTKTYCFGTATVTMATRPADPLPPGDLASLNLTAGELLRLLDAIAGNPSTQTAGLLVAARGLAYCLQQRLERITTERNPAP